MEWRTYEPLRFEKVNIAICQKKYSHGMSRNWSRREALRLGGATLGIGGLVSLAGCQTAIRADPHVLVEIFVLNHTEGKLTPWVQLGGVDDDIGAQLGESPDMFPGDAWNAELEVQPAEYELRILLDREGPALVQETGWEVTERECTHRSFAVISEGEGEKHVSLTADTCHPS